MIPSCFFCVRYSVVHCFPRYMYIYEKSNLLLLYAKSKSFDCRHFNMASNSFSQRRHAHDNKHLTHCVCANDSIETSTHEHNHHDDDCGGDDKTQQCCWFNTVVLPHVIQSFAHWFVMQGISTLRKLFAPAVKNDSIFELHYVDMLRDGNFFYRRYSMREICFFSLARV